MNIETLFYLKFLISHCHYDPTASAKKKKKLKRVSDEEVGVSELSLR